MKYIKFIIKNYKAIDNLEVHVGGNSFIPLIGVNESGKTSVLHAILAFDKDKDNLLDGYHSNPKNRYLTRQKECELIACVVFENEAEYETVGEEIALDMESPIYKWLKYKYSKNEPIQIKRGYNNGVFAKEYSIINESNEVLRDVKIGKLINNLVKKLPNILYFDDFSDRVPEEVVFQEGYKTDGRLSRGKIREWQEIIQEIFARALKEPFSLRAFLELKDEDDKTNYLSDVTKTLNEEIIEEWKRLKKTYAELQNEDNSALSLKIDYSFNTGLPQFKFKVVDNEHSQADRVFDVNTRSKGFQWFFNFIIKLRFNPKYKDNPQNAIFLLDEPGSYLHSSAQLGLLKVLKEISANNTIIYCTHSQYLLNPDIININSIKTVNKQDGQIKLQDYGNSTVPRTLGAFSALDDALKLKFGFHQNMLNNCILTEGIVDYYFFKMFLDQDNINYIPGAGCGHLKELISILISCSNKFLVIIDSDSEGRNAYSKYTNYFSEAFTKNYYQYQGVGKGGVDFELEDILSDGDKKKLCEYMDCTDLKRAITALYYSKEKTKMLNNIDDETKRNIMIINKKISEFFSG